MDANAYRRFRLLQRDKLAQLRADLFDRVGLHEGRDYRLDVPTAPGIAKLELYRGQEIARDWTRKGNLDAALYAARAIPE